MNKTSEFKKLKCLKCDKSFKTTIEIRVCNQCKLSLDSTFDWGKDEDKYGDMGI